MQHLTSADYRVMPWKDGGGTTTELAIHPPGATVQGGFAWRLSSARVEASGPFSTFPGMARSLALVEGVGLILDLEGVGRLRLKHPREVIQFAGGVSAHATLIQGPVTDLGLIHDPARFTATLEVRDLTADATSLTLAPTTLLHALGGPIGVDPLGLTLAAGDTLRLEEADRKLGLRALEGAARVAVVHLTPR